MRKRIVCILVLLLIFLFGIQLPICAQESDSQWKPWLTVRYDTTNWESNESVNQLNSKAELDHLQSGVEIEFSFGLTIGMFVSEFDYYFEKEEILKRWDCFLGICARSQERQTTINYESTVKFATIGYNLTNVARTRFLSFAFMAAYDMEGEGTANVFEYQEFWSNVELVFDDSQYSVEPKEALGTYIRAGLIFGKRISLSMRLTLLAFTVEYDDEEQLIDSFSLGLGIGLAI